MKQPGLNVLLTKGFSLLLLLGASAYPFYFPTNDDVPLSLQNAIGKENSLPVNSERKPEGNRESNSVPDSGRSPGGLPGGLSDETGNGQGLRLPIPLKLKMRGQYPHATDASCQGLHYEYDTEHQREILYESTGQYGRTRLRCVELKTGKIIREQTLASQFFGEGLALVDQRIYQLTWQERTCFVYDKSTFRLLDEIRFPGEGWGLVWDGEHLILSDGSSTLRFLDPKNLKRQKSLTVTYKDKSGKRVPLKMLNELEYIEGEIWANVYQTTKIARIDPKTGFVIQFINFASLVPKELTGNLDYVLNGIAYDPQNHRLFLTGKCWPVLYEIGWE